VYGYAWYKLAYVFWNLGELPQALNAFKKTIDYGAGNPQGPGAAHLAETARKEIVTVYALAGDPSGAYAFFKTLSGDPPASSVRTYEMMNGLGRSYLDSGHYPEAISLYRDLLVRDATGDRTCDYQSHVTEATMAMKSGDKTAITGEIDKQLERLAAFRRETHADESKQRCANLTAALASETAMAWHLEAVGTDARRGTGDPRTMDLAAALYAKVASTFTAAELASFTFPHLVREDWPTLAKIRYAMADLLYARERWGECGKAFDDVVAEDPKGELAKDAAYVSVLCHYDAYLGSHRSGAERVGTGRLTAGEASRRSEPEDAYRTRPLTADENGMVRSFDRYLCAVGGDVADAAVRKQRDEVSFARCRLYFDAKQWGPSAACFHDIAFRGPDGDAGDATRLYLESLEVLARHGHPDRPACIDDMASDVPKLQDRLCTGDGAQHDEVICSDLTKVACSIERIRAQRLVELADEGGNDAVELFEKGARAYLSIWDRYGASRLRENKAPQCERLDEVLENAARAFQAAHLIASAIRTRSILVDPLYHLNGTDLAKDAAFKIGGNWQAIAVYDQAADWYESYAQRNPRRTTCVGDRPCPADAALSDAVLLRLGLGQEDRAVEDARRYQSDYAGTDPAKAAQIAFAVGAHYADGSDWENARRTLAAAMPALDRAPLDVRIEARATYARALDHLHSPQAAAQYAQVRRLWGDGEAARAHIAEAHRDEPEDEARHRIGKALDAVGEAVFFAAEERKRAEVDRNPFPPYRGPGTRTDIDRYMKQTLGPWVTKRRATIEAVDHEYRKVSELQPAPPSRWIIAAASRAGMMWGDFVDDFRRAPYPREWDRDGYVPGMREPLAWHDLRAAYIEQVAKASEPIKREKALPALKRCLDDSVKYQYFDAYSRTREQWLAHTYKTEYHVVDELRGAATLANSGLEERPPPVLSAGQLWHGLTPTGPTEKVDVLGAKSSSER
jgi:tetratricopeptide (TPR) repeat protein